MKNFIKKFVQINREKTFFNRSILVTNKSKDRKFYFSIFNDLIKQIFDKI